MPDKCCKIFSILAITFVSFPVFGQEVYSDYDKMNKQTVYNFANAINEHDVEKINLLMTDDHKFIDAHGNEIVGKDKMKTAWTGYFQWFPDYTIEITEVFVKDNYVAAFGFASGTFKGEKTKSNESYWRLPASWKVAGENEKIKLWQVYADTKIPFDIINRHI